ncbi:MAG: penicillin-binding transpeptidase domain-containing protein, partial [Bilophila sp.]
LLGGLPQAPSRYNPYRDRDAAISRQHYVLRRLHEVNWITAEEYEAAIKEPLVFRSMPEGMGREGAWYLEEVRRQLIDLFNEENVKRLGLQVPLYGEEAVYELGLTVQTAMNPPEQIAGDTALREGLERFGRRQGWSGPLEKIAPDKLAARLAEATFEPSQLANGGWAKAIVTKVGDKAVEVRLGAYAGTIEVQNMSWARIPNPKVSPTYAPAIRDARKVLEPGDVVWVSGLGADAKTVYNPALIQPNTSLRLALQTAPEVQGALVSIEPQTGDVVAMIGGYDFHDSQFNRATQAYRQPGSSFKPIVYSAAMDNGFTPASVVLDAPVVEFMESGDVWRPANYEKGFKGPMILRTALALSRNLVTIRVAQQIGIRKVIERAKVLELEPTFPEGLAISLGAVAVTPLNMTQAYTAFANGGMVSKARFILSVKDFWGETIYEPQPDLRDAISPQNAYIMASMLKDVVNAGTAGKARVLGRPVAGKTGTSNNEHDAWFIGFTPYLVTGVYIGYDQLKPMGRDGSGSSAALPIFVEYAKTVFEAYPPDDFPVPEGITFADVDASTGRLASAGSGVTLRLPFY